MHVCVCCRVCNACACICYVVCERGRWVDGERKAEVELQHGTFFTIVKGLEAHLRMTLQRTPFISVGSLSELSSKYSLIPLLKALPLFLSAATFSSICLIREAAFLVSAYNHFHYSSQIIA